MYRKRKVIRVIWLPCFNRIIYSKDSCNGDDAAFLIKNTYKKPLRFHVLSETFRQKVSIALLTPAKTACLHYKVGFLMPPLYQQFN